MKEGNFPIIEIFNSVQGEGSWLGIPVTFIRFAGCNLRCDWCDTKNAWGWGLEMDIKEIVSYINNKHVILTGGEPSLYPLESLVKAIKEINNAVIAIETNGTRSIPSCIDWIVCSPKPSSNYIIQCKPNELKYVVDENFKLDVIPNEYISKIPIWLQPNAEDLERSVKKCYNLVMQHEYLRLGIQLHKFYNLK